MPCKRGFENERQRPKISKNIFAVNYVPKMNDVAAVDPWTKKAAYIPGSEKSSLQSNQMILPIVSIIGKETKALTREAFSDQFNTMQKEMELGENESSGILGEGYFPIFSPVNCDMKVTHNALGRGGAFKVKEFACHACCIHKDEVVQENVDPCTRWCSYWLEKNRNLGIEDPKWSGRCYHHEWLTTENHEKLLEDTERVSTFIDTHLGGYDSMMAIRAKTKMNTAEDPMHENSSTKFDNPASIFFKYEDVDTMMRYTFFNNLIYDLRIRGIEKKKKTWEEKVFLLRDHLNEEYRLIHLKNNLEHSTLGREDALFMLENNVPCVLHLEMRTCIKIINMLFKEAFTRAVAAVNYHDTPSEAERKKHLKNDVEEYMPGTCSDNSTAIKVAIILCSVLGAIILVGLVYIIYKRFQNYKNIKRAHEQLMEATLNESVRSLHQLDYPLHLVRGDEFVEDQKLMRHEVCSVTSLSWSGVPK